LNSSDAKVLNWKPRSRRRAPSALLAPEVDRVSNPFRRTRVKSPPRPRTEIELPSPFSRSIDTPGIRCSDSARLASGKSAMSSALMTSTMVLERRFSVRALASEARMPVTTISPTSVASSLGVSCGWTWA